MPSVHFAVGYTAKALMPSHESKFRPLPKQLQPPFLSRFVTSHSNALRTVQALSAHPPSLPVLLREDLFGPSFPRDHPLGGHDLRIVERSFEQLGEGEKADGRLVVLEEPIQRAFRLHLRSAPPDRLDL